MPKEVFMHICSELGPAVRSADTRFRKAVPVQVKIGAVLYKLVTGVNFFNSGELFGIGESSVHECMPEVISAIISILGPRHLYWPNREDMRSVSEGFRRKCGLVGCQGAIDGSHIRIRAPIGKEVAIDYYNRKGFHSILLQGICDSDSVFLDIAVGFPGSMNDKRMLRLSTFYDLVQSGRVLQEPTLRLPSGVLLKPYILGDAGYSMAQWCMVPYSLHLGSSDLDRIFTEKHIRGRLAIEQAFGMLKNRYSILQNGIRADVAFSPKIVHACLPGVSQLRPGDTGHEVRSALAEYLALAT
ncbi:hypothetical protein R1sor_025643 [Riccia sorocarpa]|uniref:DDE Tnp4 domain-containing protein n=1 Tax=Riccia sorocarpa TaxID=122646 RepID=A0ABD3GC90_9MARC